MNGSWKKIIAVMLTVMMLSSTIPVMGEEVPTPSPTIEVLEEVSTEAPTETPTEVPTEAPVEESTEVPTEAPAEFPVEIPTEEATGVPTEEPAETPTEVPTEVPTEEPTEVPTEAPTEEPTEVPAEVPTEEPAEVPTEVPTEEPTEAPTEVPTEDPTEEPTVEPTEEPAEVPDAASPQTAEELAAAMGFETVAELAEQLEMDEAELVAMSGEEIAALYQQTMDMRNEIEPMADASEFIVDENGMLTAWTGTDTNLVIPSDLGITSIGASVFKGKTGLVSVTIPEGVISIGRSVFTDCTSLESVSLPSGLKSIDYDAFHGCTALKDIELPSSLTSLGSWAFGYCSSLRNITLPSGITSIDYYTFNGCTSLESVSLPEGLTNIAPYAFCECTGLKSVSLPSSLTSIDQQAFWKCTSLQNVSLPSGLTSIGESAFGFCTSLTSVTLPSSLTSIGEGAFCYCEGLRSVSLPSNLTGLVSAMFRGCTGLESITLPAGLTSIGSFAFGGCTALRNITLPAGLKSIEGYTFSDCTSLESITLPEYLTSIGEWAFSDCTSLKNITLPTGLTSIGAYAFKGCTSWQSVTLPSSVTSIGDAAFSGCDQLTAWVYSGSYALDYCETQGVPYKLIEKPVINSASDTQSIASNGSTVVAFTVETNEWTTSLELCDEAGEVLDTFDSGYTDVDGVRTWQVSHTFGFFDWGARALSFVAIGDGPDSAMYEYPIEVVPGFVVENGVLTEWRGTTSEVVIPDDVGITSIGSDVFTEKDWLQSVTIPEGVTSINANAFWGSTSLQSVSFPSTLRSIGESAFENCTSLESVTLPSGLESIGTYAFRGCTGMQSMTLLGNAGFGASVFESCTGLQSVSLPSDLGSIGSRMFYNCASLQSVTLPENLTSMGESAFSGCTSLESVTLPSSLTSIGYGVFNGCTGLRSVTLSTGLTEIGSNMFYDCTSLESVTMPSGLTRIGNDAFNGCKGLQSVTLPTSLTEIGFSAFCDCTALKSVSLPSRLRSLSSGVFNGCTSLENVSLPTWLMSIGDGAFAYCTNLQSITLPSRLTEIGYGAFDGCTGLQSITLPASLTSIGSSAFAGCSGLQNITLPTGLKSIGDAAFSGCSGLQSITLPADLTSIGDAAFSGCSGLQSITLPAGLTSISDHAFSYCTGLQSIALPTDLTSIGDHAFSYCTSLQSIALPTDLTSIGDHAFDYCTSLQSITLPTGLTSIGGEAFSYCTSLESITLSPSLTSIGENAFYNCYQLTAKVYSGSYALDYCKANGIHYVIIDAVEVSSVNSGWSVASNGATVITYTVKTSVLVTSLKLCDEAGEVLDTFTFGYTDVDDVRTWQVSHTFAFSECGARKLSFIASGDGEDDAAYEFSTEVTPGFVVENGVLTEWRGTTSEVVIPADAGITSIGERVFAEKTWLESVTIQEGVTEIGDYAFYCCGSLKSVTLPTSLTSIGSYAFYGCTSLQNITLPTGLTNIGSSAFHDCTSLQSITLPTGLTNLGDYAFNGCTSLESITLPMSLTSIGSDAFTGCANQLTANVYSGSCARDYCKTYGINYVIIDGVEVSSVSETQNIASNGATVLTFEVNTSMRATSLKLCDEAAGEVLDTFTFGYTDVDDVRTWQVSHTFAFSECGARKLSFIASGDGEDDAAYEFSTEVTPGFVVENGVLTEWRGTTSEVVIPADAGITSIGERVFAEQTWLESVTIQEGVTGIYRNAFYRCGSLKSVTLPTSLTSIGDGAFEGCGSLQGITLPAGLTSIGSSAFSGCTGLESITLPTGLTNIGSSAFHDCTSLQSITLPAGLTSIDEQAFYGCMNLTARVYSSSYALGYCAANGINYVVIDAVTVDGVSATQSMASSGAAVAAFTVKTSTSATSLKLCSESGAVVKTFTSGYSDANGVRTWKVSYTFANDGARQLSFIASGNGVDSAAYNYSITLAGAQVKSAKFNASAVNTGAAAQATIVTHSGAKHLHMYSEDGTLIKTWPASGYSDGKGTWSVSYTFIKPGVRTMTFKASLDGQNPKAGKTAKITVNTSTAVTSATAAPTTIAAGSALTFTVKTSSNAQYLSMYSESGGLVRTWSASGNSTVSGSERIWKLSYAFANAGDRQVTFKASSDKVNYGAGRMVSVKVTVGANVISAVASPNTVSVGGPLTFTVKTSSNAQYLSMYSESGGLVRTWSASGNSTVSGSERTWKLSYAFANAGDRQVTFKASSDQVNYGAGRMVSVKVTAGVDVISAVASPNTVSVGGPLTFTVKTSSNAQYLSMYSEGGGLVKTWTASGNSTVSGSERTWKLSYAFANAGDRQVTFKASSDQVNYGAGRMVGVKVIAKASVASAAASPNTVSVGGPLTFTVKTSSNAQYLSMYSESGGLVKTWTASGNSTVSGSERTWTLGYAFANMGDRQVTFKASSDQVNYGAGRMVSVKVIAKASVASAAASSQMVMTKTPVTFTVKTSSNAQTLSMYAEGGALVQTWDAGKASTLSGSVRTWTISYAFANAGNRQMTFKASSDKVNYGEGKTVKIEVIDAAAPSVTSATASPTKVAAKTVLRFTVNTPVSAQVVSMYAEGGALVKTWSAEDNSSVSDNVRTWSLSYSFANAGDRQVSFRASANKASYGLGKTVSVKVVASHGRLEPGMASEVVAKVNEERAKVGLAPLRVDPNLVNAANIRAEEIYESFSHTRPDGNMCFTVSADAYGENIAMGQRTSASVMSSWMNSPGHRANILDDYYGSIGVGALNVNGTMCWVQLFGL